MDRMKFAPSEKGQGFIEYLLILILVAIVVVAFLTIVWPILGKNP